MTRVPLTLACGDYDRVWPLSDGRVRPEGIDLNLITLEPEECFWRMLGNAEFDAAELSLSSYATPTPAVTTGSSACRCSYVPQLPALDAVRPEGLRHPRHGARPGSAAPRRST
jgi:hypothetical protein